MDEIRSSFSLPFFLTCLLIFHTISAATINTINTSRTIRDGETMVSSGGLFELGFFSPGNSGNRYVGMWYKNITPRTVFWVANREVPLPSKSGVLKVIEPGLLVILNDTKGITVWSSNTSRSVQNPVAELLDSGNLVVKDTNDDRSDNFLWQSFDYLSDTYAPGMSLGWDFVTGIETYLSSWKSDDDPAPGEFVLHLDIIGYPQLLLKKGNVVQCRLGPWNGVRFNGGQQIADPVYRLTTQDIQMNKNKVKYRQDTMDGSVVVVRNTLGQNGVVRRWTWNDRTKDWENYFNMPADDCDSYNLCGAHGICSLRNSSSCGCLDGFVPEDPQSWSRGNWSNGCTRRAPLNCQGDVFLKYSGIKLPDSRNSWFNQSMNLEECEAECLKNCSCMAHTQLDIREGGSGCLLYYGELIDLKNPSPDGQDIYIRMASSMKGSKGKKRGKKTVTLIASATSAVGMVLLCLTLILCIRKRRNISNSRNKGPYNGSHAEDTKLPFFKLSTVLKATDNFSVYNKLGEGGFGPVYKGMLEDGEEIAVKRCSKTSSQGVDELTNEVIFIAKLQHRNLVRLLGCCIEGEENMLIYEYMPNNSLDQILFDQTKNMLLEWPKRFQIIKGIAKGLLYLHQDSRLRIIHRDLKASNILLDSDLNPKISDFGLARSFGGNETQAKTRRVVGTYGYMSPEYAIDGLFSVKSDVFSFGVLMLEVVSGTRNRGFSINDHNLNLLGHAWTLYKEENLLRLVDSSLHDLFELPEVLRSIHVGLLCVQKCPEDRPNMSSVVFMLENEVTLPQAKQPGFFTERDIFEVHSSSNSNAANSVNEVTISWIQGR